MSDVAMLYNQYRCIGCRACQVACKAWNENPGEKTTFNGNYENPPRLTGTTWTRMILRDEGGWLFRAERCMHCTDANCVTACPVEAQSYYPQGFVVTNQERCIGCRACVLACPYGVVNEDKESGTAKKCHFCFDRVLNGAEPACVKSCPTDALTYGDRNSLLSEAKEKAKKNGGIVYGEKEFFGLHHLYLLKAGIHESELPEFGHSISLGLESDWAIGLLGVGGLLGTAYALLKWQKGDE